MKQYIVDAFTEELFCGNPAAVLPCRNMPPYDLCRKIAVENNYSETAFVVKRSDGLYDLKWFTPEGEIDLCGHATLAAAFVLSRYVDKGAEEMRFSTLSGELVVRRDGNGFTMDFPIGRTKKIPFSDDICSALGGLGDEAWFDGGDMVVVADHESDVELFEPDFEKIKKLDGLGLILTAGSGQYDFVSRCFYPKCGVLEDPVTGRAHTFLAPIWAEKLGKDTMTARQISSRGGVLTVHLAKDRVFIGGRAVLFMEGEIPFAL